MSTPRIFDGDLIRHRLARATRSGAEPFLADHAAAVLAGRLEMILRDFPLAIDLGSSHGRLAPALERMAQVGRVVSLDRLARPGSIVADPERLPLAAAGTNLVASVWGLGFVNDLPGAFIHIRRALKPDGLFLAVLPGAGTLTELRAAFAAAEAETTGGASPRVAPFIDVRDAGSLLQRAGFALPVADSESVVVRYDSAFALMADLRRMGATNALADRLRRPTRRAVFSRMAEIYADRFSDPDGRVRATFEMVSVSGWAPHESQQQPLRPGSAKMRLADALGTGEIPLPRDGG